MGAARVSLEALPELAAETVDPEDLPFRTVLGAPYFEGLIMYLGAGRQVTPLHFDEQENLVFVLRGSKDFLLYPPCDSDKMYPGDFPKQFFSRVAANQRSDLAMFPKFSQATPWLVTVAEGEC